MTWAAPPDLKHDINKGREGARAGRGRARRCCDAPAGPAAAVPLRGRLRRRRRRRARTGAAGRRAPAPAAAAAPAARGSGSAARCARNSRAAAGSTLAVTSIAGGTPRCAGPTARPRPSVPARSTPPRGSAVAPVAAAVAAPVVE